MLACRVILDPARNGALNMALDEALAESVAESGEAVLRFYFWESPTLSLGYFQGSAERTRHASSARCPLVRRASGGGAILHDRELTYCLALPAPTGAVGDAPQLYCDVHTALVATLGEWNVSGEVRPRSEKSTTDPGEPFLCFQRKAYGDVLVNGVKVCGGAQRRRRGVLLQHGSVLLAQSPAAPELPGIRELTGVDVYSGELWQVWLVRLQAALKLSTWDGEIRPAEFARAEQLVAEKYGTAGWTARR